MLTGDDVTPFLRILFYSTNVDFAKHLLALHATASRCSNFTGVVMGHARSTESRRLVSQKNFYKIFRIDAKSVDLDLNDQKIGFRSTKFHENHL